MQYILSEEEYQGLLKGESEILRKQEDELLERLGNTKQEVRDYIKQLEEWTERYVEHLKAAAYRMDPPDVVVREFIKRDPLPAKPKHIL